MGKKRRVMSTIPSLIFDMFLLLKAPNHLNSIVIQQRAAINLQLPTLDNENEKTAKKNDSSPAGN
jgi:hypothetical protein